MNSIFILRSNKEIETYLQKNLSVISKTIQTYIDKPYDYILGNLDTVMKLSDWYVEFRIDGKLNGIMAASILDSPPVIYIEFIVESEILRKSIFSPVLIYCLYVDVIKKMNSPLILFTTWINDYLFQLEKLDILNTVPYDKSLISDELVLLLQEIFRISDRYFNKAEGKIYKYFTESFPYKIYFYKVNNSVISENKYAGKISELYSSIVQDSFENNIKHNRVRIIVSDKIKDLSKKQIPFQFMFYMYVRRIYFSRLILMCDINPYVSIEYCKKFNMHKCLVEVYADNSQIPVERFRFSSKAGKKMYFKKSSYNKIYLKKGKYFYIPGNRDPYVNNNICDISDMADFINYLTKYELTETV